MRTACGGPGATRSLSGAAPGAAGPGEGLGRRSGPPRAEQLSSLPPSRLPRRIASPPVQLPRLPHRFEHRVLRLICALPPRMQRRLFPGPVIDGFEPAPDISALLWLARLVGGGDFSGGGLLTPLEARQRALSESTVVDGPRRLRLPVEDLTIPGPSGPLGARLYLPPQRAPEPPPLIVYYHGGGWVVGNLDTHDSACRFLALSS